MLDRAFIKNGYIYSEYGDAIGSINNEYIYNLKNNKFEFYIKNNVIYEINGKDKYWMTNNYIYYLGNEL